MPRAARTRFAALASSLAALLAATPSAAQLFSYTGVYTQSDVSSPCGPPGCSCTVNGIASLSCGHVRSYQSDNQPTPQTDADTATLSGTFGGGFDSTVVSNLDLLADADFGTLKVFAMGDSATSGAYVEAGGLAIPGISHGFAQAFFGDQLTVSAPVPGGQVALSIGMNVTSTDAVSVSGGGLSIDPCLANGHGRTELEASLSVIPLSGSGGGLAQYARDTHTCNAPVIIGGPNASLVATVPDGGKVNVSEAISATAYARQDGGEGGVAHPNRVRSVAALLDASNTARLTVTVLTPGASYTSASGTTYAVPEPDRGAPVALAAVAVLRVRRRRRG